MMAKADNTQLPTRAQPLYKSLIVAMRRRIESGELPPGSKAPSESDLIAEFRVSSTTARRCLDELERLNLVRRVQGKGTFVSPESPLKGHRQIGILYNELFNLAEGVSAHIFRGVGPTLEASQRHAMLLAAGALRRAEHPAEALHQIVRQQRLEALLVMSPLPLTWLHDVLAEDIPVASVNFAYDDPRIFAAIVDAPAAMRRMSDRLAEAGHRYAVMVRQTFPPDLLQGVVLNPWNAAEITRVEFRAESFPYFGPDQTQELIDRCLAQLPRPTAFLTLGYENALRARHAIKARGHSVPEDISLMFFGAPPGPSEIDGELVPIEAMSVWATNALLHATAGSAPSRRVEIFQSQPQAGNTLARAPRK